VEEGVLNHFPSNLLKAYQSSQRFHIIDFEKKKNVAPSEISEHHEEI
jgi:hypothetical protein